MTNIDSLIEHCSNNMRLESLNSPNSDLYDLVFNSSPQIFHSTLLPTIVQTSMVFKGASTQQLWWFQFNCLWHPNSRVVVAHSSIQSMIQPIEGQPMYSSMTVIPTHVDLFPNMLSIWSLLESKWHTLNQPTLK